MSRLKLIGFLPLLLALAWPGPALSQYEEEEFFRAGDWVETASKHRQRIEEAPAAVTVLTEEEIRRSGATGLGDLLRQVPGLEVISLSPSDHEIGARGQVETMENAVLVLVDGRSIYMDFFGNVLWDKLDFPLEQIQQIEVVRGPGSVLYGANALHAVINIITKAPGDSPGFLFSLTGGPDTLIGTVMESGRSGRMSHLASLGWTQFSSFQDWQDVALQYPRARVSLAYDLGRPGKVQVDAGIERGDHELFQGALRGMLKITSMSGNITAKYSLPGFYFRAFWNSTDADRLDAPRTIFSSLNIMGIPIHAEEDWEFKTSLKNNVLDCEAQKTLEAGKSNTFTLGGNYRFNEASSPLVGGYRKMNLFGAYLQHEFRFRQYLGSNLGFRYDYNPLVGSNYSPRGTILVSPVKGHSFRFSVGKSFRNPNFMEAYLNLGVPLAGIGEVYVLGNTGLKSEEVLSFDGGYQASLSRDRIRLNLNAFYNRISNLMDLAFLENISDLPVAGRLANMHDETARGLEAEIRARPYDWASAFANYSLTYVNVTREWYEGQMTDADDIPGFADSDRRAPRHKLNLGITADFKPGISSTILFHYVGETYWNMGLGAGGDDSELTRVPAYTLLNLQLAYRFFHDRAQVALNVFNLLNNEHREYPLTDRIGTRITGNARISF